jgi:serine/threonine-protein kinase
VSYQDSDILVMPLDGARRLVPLVKTPFREGNAEISPNGRWIAYESNENGRNQIYVRPFPNVNGGRWQVSTDSGSQPRWAPSGHELFFFHLGPSSALMSAPVSDGPPFKTGTPVQVFETASYYRGQSGFGRSYDVSPDGRFLMIKGASAAEQDATPASITVVTNWFEELKRRVSTN